MWFHITPRLKGPIFYKNKNKTVQKSYVENLNALCKKESLKKKGMLGKELSQSAGFVQHQRFSPKVLILT